MRNCIYCRSELTQLTATKDKRNPDGLSSECHVCARARKAKHAAKPEVKLRLAAKAKARYAANREAYQKKNKIISRRWEQSESGKQWRRAWRESNPEKAFASCIIQRALNAGKLIRPENCEQCNVKCKPQGHHYKGYSKHHLLTIRWLCHRCHYRANLLSKAG